MAEELITGAGLATALGAKLLNDVCGPTAKYLGGEFAVYAKVGVENLKRIFNNAAERLKAIGKSDGQVPPRVLHDVLGQGYFCEDELQASYLGGVLASSKSSISRDDRAISYTALIGALSTYQLRTHFILYSAILRCSDYKPENVLKTIKSYNITVAIRETDYQAAMEFMANESPEIIAHHAFVGLEMRGLCEGGSKVIAPYQPKLGDVPFRFYYPTMLGIELFLWGLGYGERGIEAYTPKILERTPEGFLVTPLGVKMGRVSYD